MYPCVLFTSVQCVCALSLFVCYYSCALCEAIPVCSYVLCILYPVLWSYALYVSSVVFILCALCILACYLLLYDVCIVHFCVLVTPVLWYLCSGTRSALSSLYSALRSLLLALLRSALCTLYSALYSPLFTPLCALYSTLHSPLRSAFRTLYSAVDSALYLPCVLFILECRMFYCDASMYLL